MSAIKKSSVLAAVFVGLFAGTARAQGLVEAKVPFSFVIHGQEFPAGHYEIRTDLEGILSVRGIDNKAVSVMFTVPADGSDPLGSEPALVFTRYENGYRLSQIWESGGEGFALEGSSLSRKIGRGRAETNAEPSDTALACVLEAQ